MNKPNKKGFTLVELIVVIVILGILAVVVIPAFASYSAKANEATCATTRRTLLGELSAEQIFNEDKNLEEVSKSTDEGKAFLAKTECPSGGTITVSENEIYCSKHGKTISEGGLLNSFIDTINTGSFQYASNDLYRNELYKQFPKGWPSVVLNGKVLYMQPYFNSDDKSKFIFANSIKELKSNWYADAFYDTDNKVWYMSNGKNFSINGMNIEKVRETAIKNGWTIVNP